MSMIEKKQGVILKGVGGFYYVLCGEEVYETRARGLFRKDGVKPLPGDRVVITPPTDISCGYLEEVLERKNSLIRPAVSNIDLLLIVIAAKAPAPDMLLVDKLLVYAACSGIRAAIAVNKCDWEEDTLNRVRKEYNGVAAVYGVSAKTGAGIDELCGLLEGTNTCFAGQSAVGKSSIINAIDPTASLKTGILSRKTDRGRHTTRHSELMYLEKTHSTVIDTPGFSVLELLDLEPEDLKDYYPEFKDAACRFGNKCVHMSEPGCSVIERMRSGDISAARYKRYSLLFEQLKERKDKKYG